MYRLRPAVRACVNHGAVVFLDLRNDRYSAVEEASAPPIAGVIGHGDGASAGTLLARGLIEAGDNVAAFGAGSVTPLHGELDPLAFRAVSAGRRDWILMFSACLRAAIALRRRRLDRVFAGLSRPLPKRGHSPATIAELAARFELMRPWFPRKRVCLFDTLALSYFLRAAGHAPRLVMGVRAKPFAAHCWLEDDGCCLNDAAETCRSYTQIASAG